MRRLWGTPSPDGFANTGRNYKQDAVCAIHARGNGHLCSQGNGSVRRPEMSSTLIALSRFRKLVNSLARAPIRRPPQILQAAA